jgi:IclR family transcriptional regulator, KDG regulon repressor
MQNEVMNNKTRTNDPVVQSDIGRYKIASVQSAIALLDAFLHPPHQFGVTELSRMAGQTKNQTFRLLQTLADDGVVVMNVDTKRYRLGYRMLEWGTVAQKSSPLVVAMAQVMDKLASSISETVVLTTLADEVSAICIDKRESSQVLQISAKVGKRVPLHAGAGSKCLLAHSTPQFVRHFVQRASPLTRFTDRTITDPALLLDELTQIRTQGYSVSDEDLDEGACSIAAPILNHQGEIVASISIASPKSRFQCDEMHRNRQAVIAAAKEASTRLQHIF